MADKIDVCWTFHFLWYKTWCRVSQMVTNIYKVIAEFRRDWEHNVCRCSAVGGTGVTKSDKSNLSCSRGLCWCRRALSLPHVMFADTSNKLHNPIPSLRSMAPTQVGPRHQISTRKPLSLRQPAYSSVVPWSFGWNICNNHHLGKHNSRPPIVRHPSVANV